MTKKDHGEIERLLAVAKRRVSGTLARLRDRHGEEEQAAYRSANADLLALERRLAEARGEPYATPLDFPVQWDTGASPFKVHRQPATIETRECLRRHVARGAVLKTFS